ncbi:hypothetical protein BN946_scf184644.g1 [Trametes cinnabarina]|uniref:Uncharacterized protein n=1 Tax=Pycnoporus cinnabarinus TaxID=5643 RepID=A0A060SNV7_PYCCI|nr:hypothetical protein BN946_scf184644.g1 [Trametes cinnabarina]
MCTFSGMVRSKPEWWEKVVDPQLVDKWRQEMVAQDRVAVETFWVGDSRFEHRDREKQWPRDTITAAQLQSIFNQLKYEASQRDKETGIFATTIPHVYETHSLIPADVKCAFLSAVSKLKLESISDEEKDWHLGSNLQVLDLVHPSLYCLRIGQSLVRTKDGSGAGKVTVVCDEQYMSVRPDFDGVHDVMSSEYQWLPTDFEVSAEGPITPLGYISNLHSIQHRDMYLSIARILSRFVLLFDDVLSDPVDDELRERYGEDEIEPWERWDREENRPFIPEPAPFFPQTSEDSVDFALNGRAVQVIIKLANIIRSIART